MSREWDFREVRRLLNDPVENKPTPDIIVSNLIAAEQYVMNRANGTGKGWTAQTVTISTVADTGEYAVTPESGPSFGKALFAYRDIGENVLMPIPFTDFQSELTNQKYQFWVGPLDASVPVVGKEKIAFFRTPELVKMAVYPVPTEVIDIVIVYAAGAVDWDSFIWADEPLLPEFARFRQLQAALATLAKCEWDGMTKQENGQYRQELRGDLMREYGLQEEEFRVFLRNPQHEPDIQEVGFWYE